MGIWGITDGIIIAGIGLLASVVVAYLQSRHTTKATASSMYNSLCEAQQDRIQQLQERLERNETELERLHAELVALRQENAALRERVRALEDERAELLAKIARLTRQEHK